MFEPGRNRVTTRARRAGFSPLRLRVLLFMLAVAILRTPAEAQAPGPGPAGDAASAEPGQPIPEAARKAIDAKRYSEAVSILEPLVRGGSGGFPVLVSLAGSYDGLAMQAAEDRSPEGRKRLAEYGNKAVTFYLDAAELALQAGDPRAQSILLRVLAYDPRNAKALLVLARLSRDSGEATRAISYYKDYIKTPEGHTDYQAQVDLGRLLVGEGFWRQAVDILEQAKGAGGAEAEQQLAMAFLTGKQPEKALAAADSAVSRAPQSPDAYLVRAGLILQLGEQMDTARAVDDTLKAFQLARDAIQANPGDEVLWQRLGFWQQKTARLVEVLRRLDSKSPLKPDAQIRLAQIISGLGEMVRLLNDHDAVRLLSDAARASDAPVALLAALAQRQRDLGQAARAVETAERILKQEPGHAIAQKIKETAGKPEAK